MDTCSLYMEPYHLYSNTGLWNLGFSNSYQTVISWYSLSVFCYSYTQCQPLFVHYFVCVVSTIGGIRYRLTVSFFSGYLDWPPWKFKFSTQKPLKTTCMKTSRLIHPNKYAYGSLIIWRLWYIHMQHMHVYIYIIYILLFMYTYIHLPQALSILCVNNVSYTLPYTDNHVVVALGKQYWVFDCWQLWPCRVSQSINSTSEWNVGFHAFPKHYLEKWNQAPIGCDISILYLHMWCTYWYVKIYTCIYIYT